MSKDDNTPAMKADIDRLEVKFESFERRLTNLETRTDGLQQAVERNAQAIQQLSADMDRRFNRVNETLDTLVTLVNNIDRRLTQSIDSHEARITQLERHVGLVS